MLIRALTRVATKVSCLRAKRPVPAQIVSAAALERRALALLDREYPRERQAHDETVYRALGLLGPDEPLRRLLVRRHVIGVGAIYDTQRRSVYSRPGRSHRNATLKAATGTFAGPSLAFTRAGVRTAFVVAPDPDAAVALAGGLAALPQGCGTCGKVGSVSS